MLPLEEGNLFFVDWPESSGHKNRLPFFATPKDVKAVFGRWSRFYNPERIHQSLGSKTPESISAQATIRDDNIMDALAEKQLKRGKKCPTNGVHRSQTNLTGYFSTPLKTGSGTAPPDCADSVFFQCFPKPWIYCLATNRFLLKLRRYSKKKYLDFRPQVLALRKL